MEQLHFLPRWTRLFENVGNWLSASRLVGIEDTDKVQRNIERGVDQGDSRDKFKPIVYCLA
jgi:hypothetical protein